MSVHNLEIKYTSGRIKSVMVYRNPNKAQIENLFKTAPIIRTLKDNNIHYAWDADLATHGAVAGKLGLSYNHEKGHCHRAHAKSFDIAEIHSNHRVDKYNKEHVILTFKQFITEALVPKVYRNTTTAALVNLSKEHRTTRFVIDKYDKIHAGDAYHFTHYQIEPAMDVKVHGTITYNKKTKQHLYIGNDPDFKHEVNHPHLERLEQMGVARGQRRGDWDKIKVVRKPKKTITEQIHYNTTVNQLKAIAKNSKYKAARFSINQDDESINGGDAALHYHDEMADWNSVPDDKFVRKPLGFIQHNTDDNGNENYTFATYRNKHHPLMDNWETVHKMKRVDPIEIANSW